MKILRRFAGFTLAAFFFFASESAFSQWKIMERDADSLVRAGSKHIYNLQFDAAEADFEKVVDSYPNHPAGYFLDAMVDWWKIWLYKHTKRYDDGFLEKIDRVIDICDVLLEKNPDDINALFFKGGALGYRGRFYAIRKNWLSSASDGKKGLDILTECLKIAPGNHDIMLGVGIYNYFAEKFPEEYPFIKPFIVFLPSGDKELGVLQLRAAANHARYAAIEAKVALLQIYYQFEEDYSEALKVAEELSLAFPENPYFQKYLGRCYIVNGYGSKAEQLWRDVILRYMDKKPGYSRLILREALYYVGKVLMDKGDNQNALKYFYKCDEVSRKIDKELSGFMVSTNLKIGQIYMRQGKDKYAKKQFDKILSWSDYKGSHAKAKRYLQNLRK